MGRFVIAAYRPKPGQDEALLAAVARHAAVLSAEGLITARPPYVMRAGDGTLLEVFEWASPEAIERAHDNPAVGALWAEFDRVCEHVPLAPLVEAQKLFAEFEPVSTQAPAAVSPWSPMPVAARTPSAPLSDATPAAVVREFWRRMASNDFDSVVAVLADGFVVEWPQSRERIRGGARFAQMNREYVAHGPWRFTINRIVDGGDEIVSDVDVSDGVQHARAISFFTVDGGKIARLVEFWPEPFAPSPDRVHLVESMD